MTITKFYAAKHGVGCSTVAALFALRHPGRTLLVDAASTHDLPAILGLPNIEVGEPHSVTENLDVVVADEVLQIPDDAHYNHVVIDCGTNDDVSGANVILVTDLSYVSLRRAIGSPYLEQCTPRGIVLVAEAGRALTEHDVEACTGLTVLARLPRDPSIARASDAGLLAGRSPRIGSALDSIHTEVNHG